MKTAYKSLNTIVQLTEFVFASVVLLAVFISFITSITPYLQVDWNTNKVFYDLIYRILLLVIGLELARLLITHNLQAVIELIAFVIARKTLKPDITSNDIILIVISFFFLMVSKILININFNDIVNAKYGRNKE